MTGHMDTITESASLFCGDCLTILPTWKTGDVRALEDGQRLHVITDPPYEAIMHQAKKSGIDRAMRRDGGAELRAIEFGSVDEIRGAFTAGAAGIATGWLLAFCTPEGVAIWRDAIEAARLRYKRACVWVKPDATPQFNGQGPAMGAEMFVTAWAGAGYSAWNGGGKRGVWTHLTNPPERHGLHPTEKPVRLMRELIQDFTNSGDVILDPFMGTGATGVAAVDMGRRFIGIEQNPEFFAAAVERIRSAEAQPRLFSEPAQRPKQDEMGFPVIRKRDRAK